MKGAKPKTLRTRRICGESINYARIKEDGAIAATEVRTEEKAPVSESSLKHAHPQHADDGTRAPAYHQEKEVAAMNEERIGGGLDGAPLLAKALGIAFDAGQRPHATLDLERYRSMMDGYECSDEQKERIIMVLVSIALEFSDLGFGMSVHQLACGQVAESEGFCGGAEQDVLWSAASTLTEKFNKIAAE